MFKRRKVPRAFAVIMEGELYGRRIINHICNEGYSGWIWGMHEFEEVPANILDDSDMGFLPDPPKCDLILSLGLPAELQMIIPEIAERAGAKAVIVAVDDPTWVPPGLRKQLEEELREKGVASVFPKPLCSLEEVGNPIIDEFAEKFGRPKLEIEVSGGRISKIDVLRGSPCGSTCYIAEKLIGVSVEPRERLWEELAKAHHSYPCLASMRVDPEIGDAILHKSQYLIREAVEEALSCIS
ncbi:MAG: thymidylate synthase [Thermoproteota archaeon]|nr:MAG: thymidylate synthase [Candidatus Korarchaeota archaeon]